mgnify:CR=1 FL=1
MPLHGADQVKKNLDQIMKERWSQVGPAWWDTVQENVMDPSLEQVPVKTGALKSTGQNILIEEPHTVTCEVGYGSESVAYAFVQHERLDFHHEAGKAKYLEDPVNAAVPILPRELIKRLEGRG